MTFDEPCKSCLQMEQNKQGCREVLNDGKIINLVGGVHNHRLKVQSNENEGRNVFGV